MGIVTVTGVGGPGEAAESGVMKPPPDPHYRHRSPAEIIGHAVWLGSGKTLAFPSGPWTIGRFSLSGRCCRGVADQAGGEERLGRVETIEVARFKRRVIGLAPEEKSRHLDVTVGKVEVAGREPRRFAFAPKGADRPIDILRAALGAQGWRPGQRVTVISDGEAVLPNLVRAAIREPVPRTGPAARRRRIGSLCHLGRQRISFVVNDGIRQPNPIMSRTFPP
jgi:hypothetical protein